MLEARAKLCSSIVNQYGSTEAGSTAFAMAEQIEDVDGGTGYVVPGAQVEIVDENDASCRWTPTASYGSAPTGRRSRFRPAAQTRIPNSTTDGSIPATAAVSPRMACWSSPAAHRKSSMPAASSLRRGRSRKSSAAIRPSPPWALSARVRRAASRRYASPSCRAPLSEQHIVEWCAERNVPISRVFLVETLPKTPSGKIHRSELKRQLTES